MAKNIPLDLDSYRFFRVWLRSTDIIWRDVVDSSIIPQWGEAVCREDTLENGQTPGERAYRTIKRIYPKLDLRWRKSELELLDLRPPKLFQGEYHGSLYSLDVKQAYCQVYTRLFFHADFPRKRLRYPLSEIATSLHSDKTGRNAVVGIARSTRNKWCQGEKVWYVKKQNRYLSPILWAHLMLILSEIAQWAITEGAIYVNTDGYAFQTAQERDNLASRLTSFGLNFRAQEGDGKILGISALSIPGIKEPLEMNVSQPTFHLEPVEAGWVDWWSKLERKDF